MPSFDSTGKPESEPGPAWEIESTEVQKADPLAKDRRGTERTRGVFTSEVFLAKQSVLPQRPVWGQ